MKKNKSAFPFEQTGSIATQKDTGMTLRDYFAAKAMSSILSNLCTNDYHSDLSIKWATEKAYYISDQMLKQREL